MTKPVVTVEMYLDDGVQFQFYDQINIRRKTHYFKESSYLGNFVLVSYAVFIIIMVYDQQAALLNC